MAITRQRAKPKDMRRTLRFLGKYFKKHAASLILITILVIIGALSNVIGTYMIKPIVNNYIVPGNLTGLMKILAILGFIYLTGVVATYTYAQMMVKVAQEIVKELRNDLFTHIQTLPMRLFDSRTPGDLMSSFTSDIDTIADALNNSFTVLIQSSVIIVGSFACLLALSVRLTLIVAVAFTAMYVFMRHSGKKSHEYFPFNRNIWEV